MAGNDIDFWERKFRQQKQTAVVTATAQDRDPQAVARARRIAGYANIPTRAAEELPEVAERMAQVQQTREVLDRSPWLAGPLQNPDTAALVGKKDLPRISDMVGELYGTSTMTAPKGRKWAAPTIAERAREVVRGIPGAFEAGWERSGAALTEIYQSIDEAILPYTNPSGGRAILEERRRHAEQYRQRAEIAAPKSTSPIVEGLLSGVQSVPLSMAALAVGVATRSPGAAAGVMGGATAAPAYQEAKRAGLDTPTALRYGVEQGGIEALTELMPASFWLEAIAKRTPFGKTIMRQLVTEIPGEQVATALQDLSTWATLHPDRPFSEYLAARPEAAFHTLLATLSGTSIQVGATSTVQSAAQAFTSIATDARGRGEALANQAMLDNVMEQGKSIEMRGFAPAEFAALVQEGAEDTGYGHVYVPIEAIDAVLEDEATSEEERAVLTLYQDQFEDARAAGGEVVVPVGDYAARFEALHQKLRDDVRLTPDGQSAKEARQGQETVLADLDKAAEESTAEVDTKQQVYDTVKQQMLAAGRTEKEAATTALLAASRAETLASERYGAYPDAMAAWKAVGFSVAPKGKGGKAKVAPATPPLKPKTAAKTKGTTHVHYLVRDAKDFVVGWVRTEAEAKAAAKKSKGKYERHEIATETITPAEDTLLGTNAAGEPIYERADGDRYRMRSDRADRPEGYPDFGGDLSQTEDVFSSTTGDGTGQGTEGEPVRSVEQSARGKTDFFADGSSVVTLFAQADFSTMLHEMSHVFLEQEFKLAQMPGASQQLKDDVAAIAKWMAANGHPVVDGVILTEAHELWARTGEKYFREGNAPTAELRSAFAQFKAWLTGVYKSIKALDAYGPSPINHEIREIMDRIVATSDAIADNALAPAAQADLGMTDAEYAAYLTSVKDAHDDAEDKLLTRMMSAIRQRETARIAEQRRNVRDKINAEFNNQPGVRALHLLRTGRWIGEPDRESAPVKLHTGWLIDNYGEEILDRLPRGLPITRGDGVVGDVVAEMTGMSSGDALVQALVAMRAQSDAMRAAGDTRSLRDAYVTRAVDEVMAQRHGDVALDEAQIREEAIAALNSERQGERLGVELRALKRREGRGGLVTPYQVLKEWAQRKIAQGRVSDVVSKSALQRYIRAHNKARTAFEEAIVKGDVAEAVRQKQAQMINHALLSEGKRVADELEAVIKRMKRYAEKEAMASVDQDYMDRIHALLAGFSFRPMSAKAIEERNGFRDWAAAQAESGHEVLVPPRMGDLSVRNYTETNVADLLELNDAMQSLIHLGRLKQKLTVAQAERELREFKDDSRARILNLPERRVPDASIGDGTTPLGQALREANSIRDYGAALRNVFSRWLGPDSKLGASEFIKMESMFDILDGTQDGTGPLNSLVVRGATQAANNFSQLMEDVMEPLVALYRDIPKKHRARLNDFITIPELTLRVSIDKADEARLGTPLKISRMQHIGMLLNTGNLSNLAKMVGGEKWGDPESATDLDRVRNILWSHASAEDQALVEALWQGVGSLWPHIARVERAMSGVVPEQVDAAPFATAHGEVRGGYWPVVWDSARSQMGKQQADDAETSMFGIGTGIATEKGHTITRTGAVAPMEYGLERVLFGHLNKVISRIAYAEWVRDTLKVVDAGDITGAIDLRLGEQYRKQIKRWIKDQIPSSAIEPMGSKLLEKIINQARINASIGVLGVSYTTGIAQTLGLGFSVGVLGEGSKTDGMKYMAMGLYAQLKAMKEGGVHGAQDFVFARSGEMSRRAKELSVETADVFRQLRDNDTVYHRAQALAFWHIGFIDLNTVAIPTWLGGYAKGLEQGLTEDEAAAYGDKMVRLSQGSGRQKDLSAVQRGNAGQKIIAMFYTPGSVFFNQQWTAVQHARAGDWSKAIMPTFWFLGMTTIMDAMMSGDWPEDDDEDGWIADEAPGWIGRNMLFGLAFGVPVVRDFANFGERILRGEYAEIAGTGWTITVGGIYKGGAAAVKLSEPDAEPMQGKDLKSMIAAGGFLFGLPGNQVGKTSGFAYDAATGAVEPEGVWDWFHGLTKGKLPEKEEAQ